MTDELGNEIEDVLRRAVAEVHPRRDLSDVQHALDQDRPRGHWVRGAVAAAAAVVLVTAGAAWLHQRAGSGTSPAAGRVVEATVYVAGPTALGERLFAEQRTLTGVTVGDAQAAVDAALGTPSDPDYRSAFGPSTTATVTDRGDTVQIDFASGARPATGVPARIALQSLVWTVDAALQRPAAVRFTVDGQVPDSLFGTPAAASYPPASRDDVLSPVSLDVDEGALLTSGSTIRGTANAFEATVEWTLRQGSVVVRHGFTTADTCCTLSPFAFELDAPPGNYTLSVSDTDPSGGEGNGVTTDSKDIEIE